MRIRGILWGGSWAGGGARGGGLGPVLFQLNNAYYGEGQDLRRAAEGVEDRAEQPWLTWPKARGGVESGRAFTHEPHFAVA